jgi:hypothetical protein
LVTDSSLQDFTYSNDLGRGVQVRRSVYETYVPQVFFPRLIINIYHDGEQGGVSINGFPEGLLAEHPDLTSFNDAQYSKTMVRFVTDNATYSDYVEAMFAADADQPQKVQAFYEVEK